MDLNFYSTLPEDLQHFVSTQILPQYDHFDAAHQRDHGISVIKESMALAPYYPVDLKMVYTIAAYHDLGLCEGREHHHQVSARMLLADERLRQWFSTEQLEVMAEAVEDHRASNQHAPRSIYGKIVAEADRLIDTEVVIRRTIQYSLGHYPELDREGHFQRMVEHLKEKYAEGGYLQLWIPESPNAERLKALRKVIECPEKLREYFDQLYEA